MKKFLFLLSFLCLLPKVAAAIQVQLAPSLPAPQLVGTMVVWTATASDSNPGLLNYRFMVKTSNSSVLAKDYSKVNTFDWGASIWSGDYEIEVTVRNSSTQETAKLSVPFKLDTRVSGVLPVVSSTANPLVALFSSPACSTGAMMRVQFQGPGQSPEYTNWRPCRPPQSMNVYVAGMRANTLYTMRAQVDKAGTVSNQPLVKFQTGTADPSVPNTITAKPGSRDSSLTDNLVLWDFVNLGGAPGFPVATDSRGRTVWYYAPFIAQSQAGALLPRLLDGGTMLAFANGINSSNSATRLQLLREIDLAGNTIRETNASRVTEQLVAMGLQSNCATGSSVCVFGAFHHDAIRLPNGNTLALGVIEKIFPPGTQGSTAPIDIIGDIVVELDADFQVVWFWNSFDHLDVNRTALLNETCMPDFAACPPLFLATLANDWLHANALNYTPDHNIIVSIRHQDWVIKIDYQDRAGSGAVLWRLGNQGDFSIVSSDPKPWFSHQHDAAIERTGVLTLFDNGNVRFAQNPSLTEHSRGQAYLLDETNKIATQVLNADLGVYSFALGSAQLLSNGDYNFMAGINNPGPAVFAQSIEVLPTGPINYVLQSAATAYRATRVPSLYQLP